MSDVYINVWRLSKRIQTKENGGKNLGEEKNNFPKLFYDNMIGIDIDSSY